MPNSTPTAAEPTYVRFEDMAVQPPLLRLAETVVNGLSLSWLWIVIGLAALWWLAT